MFPELRAILLKIPCTQPLGWPLPGRLITKQIAQTSCGKMPSQPTPPKRLPPRRIRAFNKGLSNHVVSHETLISGGEVVGVGWLAIISAEPTNQPI